MMQAEFLRQEAAIAALPEVAPEPRPKPNGLDAEGIAPALWLDDDGWSETDIPRRPWVAPGYALRGAVTVVVGAPSAMKSSLMLAWAVAVALGRDHGEFRPAAAEPGVVYNVEDDRDEQRRRLSAVLRQFNATPEDIAGKVIRLGPHNVGTLFSWDDGKGAIADTAALAALREIVAARRPSLLIVDPLAELHTAEENSNTALRAVIAKLRALAVEFNVAVVVIHHVRKGTMTPGDPDAARGASSIIGAGRIVLTLCTMAEDEAKTLGLAADRKTRSAYVRLDDAKQNYAGIAEARWYEKVIYTLGNGEHVAAAVPWKAPDLWQGISNAVANAILDDIDAGLDGGKRRYAHAPKTNDRAAWKIVTNHVSLNETQARAVIAAWIKNGVLCSRQYDDPHDRKPRHGLYVNDGKRPGAGDR